MKFEEALNQLNDEARASLNNCKNMEEMIKLFENNGLTVTKQDISSAINQKSGELSDDELENVNGGIDLTFLVQEVLKIFANKAKDKITEQQ